MIVQISHNTTSHTTQCQSQHALRLRQQTGVCVWKWSFLKLAVNFLQYSRIWINWRIYFYNVLQLLFYSQLEFTMSSMGTGELRACTEGVWRHCYRLKVDNFDHWRHTIFSRRLPQLVLFYMDNAVHYCLHQTAVRLVLYTFTFTFTQTNPGVNTVGELERSL